jgi:RES domain-containing protein
VNAEETVALLVPSAAVPDEWNLLLNPTHADFSTITFQEARAFEFDVRVFLAFTVLQ